MDCTKCGGKGKVHESLFGDMLPCDWCHGTGVAIEPDEIDQPDALSEFEAEVERASLDEKLAKLAEAEKPFPITQVELKKKLAEARLSGIRQCMQACLRAASEASHENAVKYKEATLVATKGEAKKLATDLLWSQPGEVRRKAIFHLYDKLKEVESWAWSLDLNVACHHDRKEAFEDRQACLDCGMLLPDPKALASGE